MEFVFGVGATSGAFLGYSLQKTFWKSIHFYSPSTKFKTAHLAFITALFGTMASFFVYGAARAILKIIPEESHEAPLLTSVLLSSTIFGLLGALYATLKNDADLNT